MTKMGIIVSVLTAIVGLVMITIPAEFIRIIVIFLGIASVADGIVILSAHLPVSDPDFRRNITIRGWSGILIGILAVALPLLFAAVMWTIMLYILAVYLLFAAVMSLYTIIKLHSAGMPAGQYVWEAVLSGIAAVILFILPASIGLTVVRIGGVLLLIVALGMFMYILKNRPITEEPESVEDDNETR
jgi:uncharacterized membrane protein HdeD (DUF308 family)